MREQLVALGGAFAGRLRVVTIYIAEAHAADEWPIGDALHPTACSLKQPVSLRERRAAARAFVRELEWPFEVFVDSMSDDFEATFAAWPLRFYLVTADGKALAHVAQPQPNRFVGREGATPARHDALVQTSAADARGPFESPRW